MYCDESRDIAKFAIQLASLMNSFFDFPLYKKGLIAKQGVL